MSEEERSEEAGLSPEELDQGGEALPDRIAMSLVDANVAIPIDATIAANVLSDESFAEAEAEQETDEDQAT